MRPNFLTPTLLCLALMPLALAASAQVTAPPTSLNFQARLAAPSGVPVPDGTYNLRLRLYDALTGGTTLHDQTLNNVAAKNGVVAVKIEGFTADKFNGNAWLGISINGAAELTPRTPLVSVPYALKSNLALTVPDSSITAAKLAAGSVNTSKLADASVTAAKLADGAISGVAWVLGGNSGTNSATQFFGTTDNQPLAFRTSNVERIRILGNGNIGIGTITPKMPLHNTGGYYGQGDVRLHSFDGDGLNGTAFIQARDDSTTSILGLTLRTKSGENLYDAIKMAPLGRVAISSIFTEARLAVEPNGLRLAIGTNGAILAADYLTSSDARLKQNIETVPDALSTILGLRGVTYDWNPNVPNAIKEVKGRQYGFLAQELEQVLPALVKPGLNGYKAVNYQGVIPVLVEAVKAQQSQIVLLKSGQKAADALCVRMDAENRELKALLLEMAQRVERLETATRR